MNLFFSTKLKKDLISINKKDPKLFKKIQKQLKLFEQDPTYPSLKTHKLEGKLENSWSISIEGSVRMIYQKNGDDVTFFDIGTHDEVYR